MADHSMAQQRVLTSVVSLVAGCLWIAVWHFILMSFGAKGVQLDVVFFDYDSELIPYPLTIQNLMWLIFFFGFGELYLRVAAVKREETTLRLHLLPEDETTLLRVKDLAEVYRRVKNSMGQEETFLPQMIIRIILQFQTSRAADQAHALLNSSLELHNHEIDLRYTMLRYVAWLIPTLGFLGTVVGIALAMNYVGSVNITDPNLLATATKKLAVAFNTTLVALIQAAILVFIMNITQAREERALNYAAQYCLDNLINRLFVKPEGE
ncbi:MAG: MotA/TolQ/ExbB proton channel family protein [Magnetococcales bacterium]|nr:MotA/TolQ/ExbB proton channel family protein [Magnetococcales bacterium]